MKIIRLRSVLRISLSLTLLTVFLTACAAGTSTVAPTQPEAVEPSAAAPATEAAVQETALPMETLAATAIPAATSRGPDLHATDPSTVNLASGGLQLVEFFRFT